MSKSKKCLVQGPSKEHFSPCSWNRVTPQTAERRNWLVRSCFLTMAPSRSRDYAELTRDVTIRPMAYVERTRRTLRRTLHSTKSQDHDIVPVPQNLRISAQDRGKDFCRMYRIVAQWLTLSTTKNPSSNLIFRRSFSNKIKLKTYEFDD